MSELKGILSQTSTTDSWRAKNYQGPSCGKAWLSLLIFCLQNSLWLWSFWIIFINNFICLKKTEWGFCASCAAVSPLFHYSSEAQKRLIGGTGEVCHLTLSLLINIKTYLWECVWSKYLPPTVNSTRLSLRKCRSVIKKSWLSPQCHSLVQKKNQREKNVSWHYS